MNNPTGMCDVTLADFRALVLHLMTMREDRWNDASFGVIRKTQLANAYRKKIGSPHPEYGNGTISSTLSGWDKALEPAWCDPLYLSAQICVAKQLIKCQAATNKRRAATMGHGWVKDAPTGYNADLLADHNRRVL